MHLYIGETIWRQSDLVADHIHIIRIIISPCQWRSTSAVMCIALWASPFALLVVAIRAMTWGDFKTSHLLLAFSIHVEWMLYLTTITPSTIWNSDGLDLLKLQHSNEGDLYGKARWWSAYHCHHTAGLVDSSPRGPVSNTVWW